MPPMEDLPVTQAERQPTTEEPLESFPGLTFADGFQFGCGFMVAVTLSLIILALAVFVIALLLPLVGIHVLR